MQEKKEISHANVRKGKMRENIAVTTLASPLYVHYTQLRLSTHPVISVFLLHGIWVEEPDDSAWLRLPVLFVDLAEQEQRHIHFQVMEVVQFPDAEGFALRRGSAQSKNGTVHSVCCILASQSHKKNTREKAKTYTAVALRRGLVDQHGEGHPVALLQLLPSHAFRHLRQTDQTAIGHLAVHFTGGNPRSSEMEKRERGSN